MVLKTSIDGTARAATERVLPNTVTMNNTGATQYQTQERLGAQWFCMADCSTSVAAGMHEISVKAFMRQSLTEAALHQMPRSVNGSTADYDVRVFQRLTMGIHNVAAVCFL